ncbi:MAG TPA: L,D-transpeptidase family protein [Thermoleophilaceae bacterium]
MAISAGSPRKSFGRRHALWAVAAVLVVAIALLATAVLEWSGASLTSDPVALAHLKSQPLAGSIESAQAFDANGKSIPLSIHGGRLTPRTKLAPGERISVNVVVRRPGWLSWALGKTRHETLTLHAPVAHVTERWLTVAPGSPLKVSFDRAVSAVAYGEPAKLQHRRLSTPRSSVDLGAQPAAGTFTVAAAARPWERLGHPQDVSWFPPARSPVVVGDPAPGTQITPSTHLRLTFSKPVDRVLGSARPKLSPAVAGSWQRPDSHTLLFTPSGFGAPFGTTLHVTLPKAVSLRAPDGGSAKNTRTIDWSVPGGSTLRLHQLLAEAGYLPVTWHSSGPAVPRTPAAQVAAATNPPQGQFSWRYSNTPPELRRMWSASNSNQITRGALMMFEDTHGLQADGFAGPKVWHALLTDAIAGKRHRGGYSYVYVHRNVPQKLTLWHNGHVVLTSPGNTGVPSAPTQLGTFPVFEHIPVGTMSGTNPDGSHYNDPGIKWISYFNGGDALHAFNRASFGTPQSLGCVELPLAAAAKVWPYTPIGTLVTIEN